MSSLSLRRGALLIAAAYGLLIVVMAAVVIPQLLHVRSDLDLRRDTLIPAQRAVAHLRAAATDQETGERGFIITGNVTFLDPYQSGRDAAAAAIVELRAADPPGYAADVDQLAELLTRWQRDAAEPEIAARTGGSSVAPSQLVEQGIGRSLFDRLRDQLDAVDERIGADVERTGSRLSRAVDTLIICLAVSLGVAVLLTIVVWFELRRWITRPVGAILDALRAVRDGDHERRVPAIGASELAEIGDTADEMRLRIVEELDQVGQAREALEQTGPVVLLLRSELEPEPIELPAGLGFAGRFHPAEGMLAGDFYDVVRVSDTQVGFVVADVSGHGAEAGVMAVRIKYLMAAALQMGMGPDAVLDWVAVRLGDTDDMFATCVVVIADAEAGTYCYASAGHPAVLFCSNGTIDELEATGPLLGPYPGHWGVRGGPVDGRALLVIHTDGLVEARGGGEEDGEDEEFGVERLRAVVADHCDDEPDVLASAVITAVRRFAPAGIIDDLTVAVVAVETGHRSEV